MGGVRALLAARDMAAERRRAAALDRRHDLESWPRLTWPGGPLVAEVIGCSCLDDEVANPSILRMGRRPHHHLFISLPSSARRAALSRESGCVPWHNPAVSRTAALACTAD